MSTHGLNRRWPMSAAATVLAGLAAAGCGGDRGGSRGSSGPDGAMAAESTRFGDDRARQGDSVRIVPDVAVLERLIDQYEGLDVVMDELAGPTSESPVQGKAWKGDHHEDAAKARLLDLLLVEFGERYHPSTPDAAARTTDSIASLPRNDGTRALNDLVLDHHRRVARAIDQASPTLQSPRVREVLTELREDLEQEIRRLAGT